ncbi:hypothetical protein RBH76_10535 [Oscillospiraceae bacterium MB24-C1]|nr:hypothetical protein RBH76_10535 [Oscillospiraceae bacterium MB24-C1]
MEVYLYGTANEVTKAQAALKILFPESEHALPVFDLPDTPEQIYCRVKYKCRERTAQNERRNNQPGR